MTYRYYQVVGEYEGAAELLFGSFVKADCVSEIEAEHPTWQGEGYRKIKLQTVLTTEAPSLDAYTEHELAYSDADGVPAQEDGYWQVTDAGLAEIAELLKRFHKNGEEIAETPTCIAAWAEEVGV